ncbi:MAG: VWA domain-containing protein [Clostridia bacterium]|nr:VWA domain-containing protein [Clostridia bacterium]
MKKNALELIFILDRSGSMSGLESDTIGGFNAMLEKQKQLEGDVFVSTVLFNHESAVLHDRKNIRDIPPMTARDYMPAGTTALLDAIGGAIHHIGNIHKYARREDVPEKTMFVIITDGMENASHRYDSRRVKEMIRRQEERYGWEFLFLGANIDAVETGANFGIRPERAVNFHSDAQGTMLNYETISQTVTCVRQCGAMPDSWKDNIEADYRKRK